MALNRSVSKLIVNGAREHPTRPSSSNIFVVAFMWAVTKLTLKSQEVHFYHFFFIFHLGLLHY